MNSNSDSKENQIELTIIMPCLNEAETLATCVKKAKEFLQTSGTKGEVLIADNGSTDGSQRIAQECGARVVAVSERGYGSALMGGIKAANGKYIVMGDADDSYDFLNLEPFLSKLRDGYDLVMGNRFKGGIKPGAMPPLHKYLGNPVLSGIGRLFFRSPIRDFHCGLRGFNKDSIERINLQTTGMEFASEMVVKATLNKLKIAEVPTTLSPDGRSRPPHLRSFRDGWRHLRFLLMYSPRWLFFYPGVILLAIGIFTMLALTPAPIRIGNVTFDIHTMLFAAMAIITGFQITAFSLFTKIFATNIKVLPADSKIQKILTVINLERGLILGGVFFGLGCIGALYAFMFWKETSFGPLIPSRMMRITIPSLTAIVLGIQIIFSSFFLSILEVRHK